MLSAKDKLPQSAEKAVVSNDINNVFVDISNETYRRK